MSSSSIYTVSLVLYRTNNCIFSQVPDFNPSRVMYKEIFDGITNYFKSKQSEDNFTGKVISYHRNLMYTAFVESYLPNIQKFNYFLLENLLIDITCRETLLTSLNRIYDLFVRIVSNYGTGVLPVFKLSVYNAANYPDSSFNILSNLIRENLSKTAQVFRNENDPRYTDIYFGSNMVTLYLYILSTYLLLSRSDINDAYFKTEGISYKDVDIAEDIFKGKIRIPDGINPFYTGLYLIKNAISGGIGYYYNGPISVMENTDRYYLYRSLDEKTLRAIKEGKKIGHMYIDDLKESYLIQRLRGV